MNFARAIAAHADAEPSDPRDYVIPHRWTATHVARRMLDAFRVIDATTTKPGPRGHANGWPEFELDYPRPTKSRRDRPGAAEVALAEEAMLWPATFLPEGSQEIDAIRLWVVATSLGLNVQRILNRRRLEVDAIIAAIRQKAGVDRMEIRDPERLERFIAGVAASANILLEQSRAELKNARERQARTKPGSPKGIRADLDVRDSLDDIVFARKLAVERVRKIALFEQLIVRPPQALIRRSEVMPGKVFAQKYYDQRRKAAAETIADALHRGRVAIR